MHNTNAKDESLIREAEAIANGALEVTPVGSESILSASTDSNAGLAFAPATPALVLAQ